MAIQIANPGVVEKIVQLAQATGLSKTAAVEQAVDRLMLETAWTQPRRASDMADLIAQFDQVPDRDDAFDPLEWDAQGLPR